MGWLVKFLRSASEQGEDFLPGLDCRSDGTGIRGALERMGDGILDLDLDMSSKHFDANAVEQLRKDGYISKKEAESLMHRIRGR